MLYGEDSILARISIAGRGRELLDQPFLRERGCAEIILGGIDCVLLVTV